MRQFLLRACCLLAVVTGIGVAAENPPAPPTPVVPFNLLPFDLPFIGCFNNRICCTICIAPLVIIEVCIGDPSKPAKSLGNCFGTFLGCPAGLGDRIRPTAKDSGAPNQSGMSQSAGGGRGGGVKNFGDGAGSGGGGGGGSGVGRSAPSTGCAPCGQSKSTASAPGEMLADAELTRVHFMDTSIRSTLGLRTGFTWDIWLQCFPPGLDAGGSPTGIPGWQIMLSQPQPQPIDFLVMTDPTGTGNFTCGGYNFTNRGLQFFNSANVVVPSPLNLTTGELVASRAVLSLWNGGRMEFEIYLETDNTQPRGRLTRYVDRNGNAALATWKYATTDPAMTGSERSKLAIRDRITDPHGRTLQFTYDEIQQRSGEWVCTRVDLPDGNHVSYTYGPQQNLWFGSEERLIRVDHPDGSVSTFSTDPDPNDPNPPGMRWKIDDPAVETPTGRRATLWFSRSPWINPANPADQREQIFGRVMQIADGMDDITYRSWFALFPAAGGGTESRTYTWNMGVLTGMVHDNGYKPTASYVWQGGPPGTNPINADWAGWRLITTTTYTAASSMSVSESTTDGYAVTYERDPLSERVTRATYQDGTVERWVRNALGDVTIHRDRTGRLTETAYDAVGNMTSRTTGWLAADPNNLTLAGRTSPDGLSTEQWVYWLATDTDPERGLPGQVRTSIDPNGNATDYRYYPLTGDLKSIVHPADTAGGTRPADLRIYNAAGRLIEFRDERAIPTLFHYDARGRLDRTDFADTSYSTETHATTGVTAGLPSQTRDRNGNITTLGWDGAGRPISIAVSGPDAVVVGRQAWTWVRGTLKPATQTIDGERMSFAYDAEMRPATMTRQVNATATLVNTRSYLGDRHVISTDPYNRRTLFVHDAEERIQRIVRERIPGGVPAAATTPAAWLALARIGGSNPPYVIDDTTFDAEGRVLTRSDGRSPAVVTAMTYDALARLKTVTEAVGTIPATTTYGYDAADNRTRMTSPRGVITDMTYTGRNLLASVTEAVETPSETKLVRLMTYTLTGKLAAEWDANNASKPVSDPTRVATTYGYGGCCDRLESITDPAGFTTTFGYDFHGNRIRVTDPNTLNTLTTYDARHRVLQQKNHLLEAYDTVYDDNLTDGVGLELDPAVAALLPSIGLSATLADGSAVKSVNPQNQRTIEVCDGLGRTIARIDALNQVTRMAYDILPGDGTVEMQQTDALAHVTKARSDGVGHTVTTIDATGQFTASGFDAAGNQLSQSTTVSSIAIGWTATYDARNRMLSRSDTRVTSPGTTTWGYDLDSNRVSETDALNKTELYVYDQRNRRTRTTDRVNGITRFAYDAVGNLTAISDADNELLGGLANLVGQTRYAYDPRNLLIAEVFPNGQSGTTQTLRTYQYDGGRRLTQRKVGTLSGAFSGTPAFAATASEVTTYAYDAANRLTTRGYTDALNDGFQYDTVGRLTRATSLRYGNAVDRVYDALGRLTSERLTIENGTTLLGRLVVPAQYTVGYGYDLDNRTTSITYPDGSVVSRGYTDRNELQTVSYAGSPTPGSVASRTYDGAGRLLTTTAGNGIVETRAYVPGDYLVASISAPSVTGFSYTYDANRRKLTESDSVTAAASQTFGYDDANRLTSWSSGPVATPTATQSWNLTKVGDWASTTVNGVATPRVHRAVHEIVSVGSAILAHDFKGNMTKDELGQVYLWDVENRLVQGKVLPNVELATALYTYDALGRRVSKTVDSQRTDYASAGAQVVQAYSVRAVVSPSVANSDGPSSALAQTPAGGGILAPVSGQTTVRINMQPFAEVIPAGYIADKGRLYAQRSNARFYGWSADRTTDARARGMLTDAAWDTLIPMTSGSTTASWKIGVTNGTYAVAIVAGDAANTDSVNNLTVNGVALPLDLDTAASAAYASGDFDGWVTSVTVTNGFITIAAGSGAINPKLVLVEIGPRNLAGPSLAGAAARLTSMVTDMTNATMAGNPPTAGQTPRTYIYGSYVDEVLAYTVGSGAQAKRYYPHYNHLYSVSALTNSTGSVVEKFQYAAYGKQTITSPTGTIRSKSAVGWDRSFTGYVSDSESGLLYARARMYSPVLGRFMARDPHQLYNEEELSRQRVFSSSYVPMIALPKSLGGYHDGMSLYAGYFAVGKLDPSGTATLMGCTCLPSSSRILNGSLWVTFKCNCICNDPPTCGKQYSPSRLIPTQGTELTDPNFNWRAPALAVGDGLAQAMNGQDCSCTDDDGGGTPKPFLIPFHTVSPEDGKEKYKRAARVAAGAGAVYLGYRCIRLIPSLFPPLWPSLPFNLATP